MMWTIPGTVLQIDRAQADYIPQQLEALFFGGGITLSQVTAITGLERICRLLSSVNGRLDAEGDDMIDETQLYFLFVKLAARLKALSDPESAEKVMEAYLADYEEPVPGAKERVRAVLRIMLTAYLAARMMQKTEEMLNEL